MIVSSQHALRMAGYGEYILNEMLFYVFLSEGKHLLMFNVQLCLTFERVSVTLKFSLCRRVELMVMELMVMDTTHIRH